jgi:gliding motility-associated-like protein
MNGSIKSFQISLLILLGHASKPIVEIMTTILIRKLLTLAFILFAGLLCAQSTITKYKYRVTAYKKDNNQIFSQSNIAEVAPPLTMYIPNAFTPNGDGMNDSFGVAGAALGDFSLKIYNRWGEKVFDSNNPDIRWDGLVNKEEAPSGVYVYKVSAKGIEGGRLQQKGNVILVR